MNGAAGGLPALAEWLAGEPDIPPEVSRSATLLVADTVGCAIGASRAEPTRVVRAALEQFAGSGPCTIIGGARRGDPVTAATVNAFSADGLDFEDSLIAHPSVAVVPAALAVAEFAGATGQELLSAVVRGYEAGVRVGLATATDREHGRIHPSQWAWQGFAAVAAAGSLLRLSASEFVSAMGWVAASTPVAVDMFRVGRPLPWTKTSFAEQTRVGVTSAFLAKAGARSTVDAVEGPFGYASSIGAGRFDRAQLSRGLGETWEIEASKIKPYPSCRMTHTAYQAAVKARRQLGRTERVERIVVHGFDELELLMEHEPSSIVDATFSIPYVVSVALTGVPPGPRWYDDRTWRDPARRRLASRVVLERDAAAQAAFIRSNAYPARVVIEGSEGTVIEVSESSADVLATETGIREKFMNQAVDVIGRSEGEMVWNTLLSIADAADISTALEGLSVDKDQR